MEVIKLIQDSNVLLFVLGVCGAIITALLASLIWFLKRTIDKTDEAHKSHSKKQAQYERRLQEHAIAMSDHATHADVEKVYEYTRESINQLKQDEIVPLKEDFKTTSQALRDEIKSTRQELHQQIADLRSEMSEGFRHVIDLINKKL